MPYKVLKGKPEEIESEMNELEKKGWEAIGGIVANGTEYTQTMKRDDRNTIRPETGPK